MREEEGIQVFSAGTRRRKTAGEERRGRRPAPEESAGRRRDERERGRKKSTKRRGGCRGVMRSFLCGVLVVVFAFFAGVGTGWYRWGRKTGSGTDLSAVEMPDWIEQDLIRKNIYSRPAVTLREVNDIVIHYVANPGSTAEENRNYFDRLADQDEDGAISASAHFVIGLDGEIIQCIPIDEIAYASNDRNFDTIAIECCHPDETGEFTEATYASLVRLTAWLCDAAGIGRESVIRHYDVSGKACPLYFVENEEAWMQFKEDVEER